MKAKKTIRGMTPIARKAAHLSREMHSLQKRMDTLTEAISGMEFQNKAMINALTTIQEAKKPADGMPFGDPRP